MTTRMTTKHRDAFVARAEARGFIVSKVGVGGALVHVPLSAVETKFVAEVRALAKTAGATLVRAEGPVRKETVWVRFF